MGAGKPNGTRTGRKLRVHRRTQKWADKRWNKAHSVTHMKANPFGGLCDGQRYCIRKDWY